MPAGHLPGFLVLGELPAPGLLRLLAATPGFDLNVVEGSDFLRVMTAECFGVPEVLIADVEFVVQLELENIVRGPGGGPGACLPAGSVLPQREPIAP